jgi:hypothetical protein
MKRKLRGKLTYANVVATLALFIAIGGASAFAASQLGKNSVGSKQLKKNAVTSAKIKKEAVTAAKVKKGTLTGTQINAGTLGTVPTATTANSLAAPEALHMVGAPGEPLFQNGWVNYGPENEPVAFYKDHEGVVHLIGKTKGGPVGSVIFQLPPGYRPASSVADFAVACDCGAVDPQGGSVRLTTGSVSIRGPGNGSIDGTVILYNADSANNVSLNGITFRVGQ